MRKYVTGLIFDQTKYFIEYTLQKEVSKVKRLLDINAVTVRKPVWEFGQG